MSHGWWNRPLCLCGREFADCPREQDLPCETTPDELAALAEEAERADPHQQ